MELAFQVLGLLDQNEVYEFASQRLQAVIPDSVEREFASWQAKWRKEALEHYLKLGWSFIARDHDKSARGFFLAQPLIFFRGQTQTIWVEHVEAADQKTEAALMDIVVRVAREKHIQRTIFADADRLKTSLQAWQHEIVGNDAIIKTTKN